MDFDIIQQNQAGETARRIGDSDPAGREDRELREACEGFEAVFLSILLKSMRATVPESSLTGESHAMDIYRSLQDQALADELARQGGAAGIGELLYRSLQDAVR